MRPPAASRRRVVLVVAVLLGALLGATACSSSGGGAAPATSSAPPVSGPVVSLKGLMFNPAVLTVKVGTTVTWRNDEPITHTITAGQVTGVDRTTGLRSGQHPSGLFDRRLAGQGDTFSYRFTKAGTYSYYCDIHYGMNARVIVRP
ncbi:MAG: cupredoxin domain-containing protein [Jatrophihabitans sp.]|uniref:cupredoxin domain-containing protein n=1 Tax=Jatrophihabitans sp. TaxID=1932789 RepID=UPI003F81615D